MDRLIALIDLNRKSAWNKGYNSAIKHAVIILKEKDV